MGRIITERPQERARSLQFAVEPMRLEHIPVVSVVERESFSQPWPQSAYHRELRGNQQAHYFVVKRLDDLAFTAGELGLHLVDDIEQGLLGKVKRLLRKAPPPVRLSDTDDLCRVVGYGGLWLTADEAHVTTIAIHPRYRGQGLGELLLVRMIEKAQEISAHWLTLEVRKSNLVAQALYRKYTFQVMGTRRRYYSDDGEDALIMWTDRIDTSDFARLLEQRREGLLSRMVACD